MKVSALALASVSSLIEPVEPHKMRGDDKPRIENVFGDNDHRQLIGAAAATVILGGAGDSNDNDSLSGGTYRRGVYYPPLPD